LVLQVLIVDNYDSFTWNLVHQAESFAGINCSVVRNDKVDINTLALYDKIILSPGPGLPCESGLLMEVIKKALGTIPMLGVCLGHQALAQYLGCELINLEKVWHGKESQIRITKPNDVLYKGIKDTVIVGRYHSWAINPQKLSSEIEITAEDDKGIPMSFTHKSLNLSGVQYHPESILTPLGRQILRNWLIGR